MPHRLRVFRLAVLIKGVNILVQTLRFAIPAIINVGILLFLVYFIYACMGVQVGFLVNLKKREGG